MICGGLRVGLSAPLALPPSVFHGFILVLYCFCHVRGFWKIWPDCPIPLRLRASPADAEETPTNKKKRALKAPFYYVLFPYRWINEVL